MPFLSRDWRSPGEKWVRYDGGWEMKKTVWATSVKSAAWASASVFLGASPDDSGCEIGSDVGSLGSNNSFTLEEEKEVPDKLCLRKTSTLLLRKKLLEKDSGEFQRRQAPLRQEFVRDASLRQVQPYCPITIKSTKEVAGFNNLADALLRLDFINSVHDIRRFDYVSKIMYTLFNSDKLMDLPGAAQKVLFRMLEEMADTVYKNNYNEHVLRSILDELNATMSIYHVWGSHLGGPNLFKQHAESRRKITEMVEKMQVKYKQDLATVSPTSTTPGSPTNQSPGLVQKLPEECIREILLRLSDPKDVERAGDACATMNKIAQERRVWRELVQTHFTKTQIEYILKEKPDLNNKENNNNNNNRDWKSLYKQLRRRFGLKEEYTEMLHLCRKCRALFWQSIGHPCLVEDMSSSSNISSGSDEENQSSSASSSSSVAIHVPIKPQTFLTFFSV